MLHSVLLWNLVSKIVSFKKIPSVNCKRTHSQYRIPHVNTQETVHFDFDDMRTDEIVTDRLRNRMSNRVESKRKFQSNFVKPEVLAPAGGWPQLRAAVANGADACYFGLQEGFNARARASNFGIDELEDVVNYLHDRGVKGYLVVNILIFDEELESLEYLIRRIAKSGVDALIMQDVGAVQIVRRVAPNLPVHGSTQMTITDSAGIAFAKSIGIERVVVGRELSVRDIQRIQKQMSKKEFQKYQTKEFDGSDASDHNGRHVEIEAFVHGALCVSYSGQCFSSEAWGGRSANRGQCAQACRMPYGLIVNGTLKELRDDVQYLLSPQDLMAIDYVPDLIKAGVRSFKIEGRLKGPEYVAITTKAYRRAVDEAWALLNGNVDPSVPTSTEMSTQGQDLSELYEGPSQSIRRDLKQVFSRGQDEQYQGLSHGFLNGVFHQELVRGNSPRHRGVYVGTIDHVLPGKGVVIDIQGPIKRGDGVVFDQGKPEESEEGGSVFDIYSGDKLLPMKKWIPLAKGEEARPGQALLTFKTGAINMSRLKAGDKVWRNKDPALDSALRLGLESNREKRLEVSVKVDGAEDEVLTIALSVELAGEENSLLKYVGYGKTSSVLVAAETRPLSVVDVKKAVGQLNETPFRLSETNSVDSFDCSELGSGLFLPVSEIKSARRDAVNDLIEKLRLHNKAENLLPFDTSLINALRGGSSYVEARRVQALGDLSTSHEPVMTLLCRTPMQVAAACQIDWLEEISLDFLEVHGMRQAVEMVKQANKRVVVATPRIIKPDETHLIEFYLRLRPNALLVRSYGVLQQLLAAGGKGSEFSSRDETNGNALVIPELRGDFSLNIANFVTANAVLEKGVERITPTHDLNAEQIVDLAKSIGACRDDELRPSYNASNVECIVHQHLAIFHTEHCVFCRFLSYGDNYTNCGQPCEKNSVSLRDMNGDDHTVLADQGCRNTVFNSKAQIGVDFIKDFAEAGIGFLRVELVDEPPDYVKPILEGYRRLVRNPKDKKSFDDFVKWLATVPNNHGRVFGTTTGSLQPSRERNRKSLKRTARG